MKTLLYYFLCLVSLFFTSSCAINTNGGNGQPGKPGINGKKGEDGEKGKDGKDFHLISTGKKSNNHKKLTSKDNTLTIDTSLVRTHLYTLASDEMQGRATGTPGIEKAAQYIEGEFEKIGLKTFQNSETYRQNFVQQDIKMFNIIGVLEGKSKKDEFVVISAHYDHIGMKKSGEGDRIYNGANDDASGVVGVLTLAKYFAEHADNERSIVFVCFTAEEIGLVGSKYFGKQIDPKQYIAGINLEMIGKEPKTGPKTAWLTGFNRSNFGKIIQKNLQGSDYKVYPDPYKKFGLFFRSDNAPLARLGIPSHTFSTTQIDTDTDYHKVTDEAETLNVSVLSETIKAVWISTRSIINGKDTPTRVILDK